MPRENDHGSDVRVKPRERFGDARADGSNPALYESLWELATDALVLSDPDGTVLAANPAYLALYGYDAGEVIGKNFAIIFPEEARVIANVEYRVVFDAPETPATIESIVRRKDGSEIVVEVRLAFLADSDGNRTAMLNTIRDITPQRRAEEAAEYAEGEQQRLFEAERAARAAAEAAMRQRDEFLATVSHDLQNPLAVIKGTAQLLRRRVERITTDPSLALDDLARRIDATADQMSAQVEDLLDLSKEVNGESFDLVHEPTDLVELVRTVMTAYEGLLFEHTVRLTTSFDRLDGHWDSVRLRRVIANLLTNACKYSPRGSEVQVEIALDATTERAFAVLRVTDRGIGIAQADQGRIFERFYRAPEVSEAVFGTGLGLTSAHHIVTLHGGTLDVESEPGKGSTFIVRLPL